MPQSLARVNLHLIFSTKQRQPFLQDVEMRHELYAYLATVLRNEVDSPAIKINGVEDHVHILCQLSRKFPVMSDVKSAKTESTKWLKKKDIAGFAWQSGYGAFSVSGSNVEQVKQYIENQQVHHQSTSFADAFRAICKKHGMEIDERFVWD